MELDSILFQTKMVTTYRPFTRRRRMMRLLWRVFFTRCPIFELPRSCGPRSRHGSTSNCGRFEICGWYASRTPSCGNAIARLKPGVSVQQATADLERLLPVVARAFPPPAGFSVSLYQSMHLRPTLIRLKDDVVGNVQNALWILLASTILVLLVACANVANLLLVRVEGRHHEFAIRYAIGAARKGISADILFESSLLGLAGSLIGLLLASGAMRVITGLGATNIPAHPRHWHHASCTVVHHRHCCDRQPFDCLCSDS